VIEPFCFANSPKKMMIKIGTMVEIIFI